MTQQQTLDLFEYRNGILYSKHNRAGGKLKAGTPVGYITNSRGKKYLRVQIGDKKWMVHKLIFLYHYGYFPEFIDHKDGNGLNNHIDNLRAATHFQNMANVKKPVTNKSGYKGVCWHKRKKKWIAQINVNNKKIHIGGFDNPVEAHYAYKYTALYHFKEFANV